MNILTATAAVASMTLAGALVAPAAQAARPSERGSYDDQVDYQAVLCARTWDIHAHDWGRFQVRSTEAGAPEVLVHDVHSVDREYHAADGSGDGYRISGKENFRITDVSRVEGDVWRIELVSAGRTWQMRSLGGVLLWADRGVVRTHLLVDTRGDDDPSNDEYESTMDWSGPHFFSTAEPGSQYCAYQAEAVALG